MTLGANLTVSAGDNLTVTNGLTLDNATVMLSGWVGSWGGNINSTLMFVGTQTLGGTGTVAFAGNNAGNSIVAQGGNTRRRRRC